MIFSSRADTYSSGALHNLPLLMLLWQQLCPASDLEKTATITPSLLKALNPNCTYQPLSRIHQSNKTKSYSLHELGGRAVQTFLAQVKYLTAPLLTLGHLSLTELEENGLSHPKLMAAITFTLQNAFLAPCKWCIASGSTRGLLRGASSMWRLWFSWTNAAATSLAPR